MEGFIPIPEQTINETLRSYGLETLLTSLTPFLAKNTSFSETQLRDAWLSNLQKNPEIFPNGWYMPPPHGIGVLIGDTSRNSRINYDNLRKFPPLDTCLFDANNTMIYVYVSPVDKKTGIIGDSGGTFYFGDNPNVQQHLKQCFDINLQIAESIQVGMTFADIFDVTMTLARKHDFVNEVVSITDPKSINIGHTIPPGFAKWSDDERKIVEKGTWEDILDIIRNKRVYVNSVEQTKLEPGTMVTIEPRFTAKNNPHIPMASYHTTLHIGENGQTRLLTHFDELFQLFGMDYML